MNHRLIALTACIALLGVLSPIAQAESNALAVEAPYVRQVPPNAPTSAAFMRISNNSPSDRALVNADSPVARSVELHTHRNEDGVMKMRQVARIEIKAWSQIQLKPGGDHIMLIGLKQPLKADDGVALTLEFDDGSAQQIVAPVRALTAEQPAAQPDMADGHLPTGHQP